MKLVWDKKYDESGNIVAPLQVALPFQTIETLNESSQQRQKSIELFLNRKTNAQWRNRLIWGDKKYVLPSLLPEFANKIDLIYIDPPFDTGADFSYLVEVPDHIPDNEANIPSFTKLPSIIEQKAYRDTWGNGSTHLDSYLRWIYETLFFLDKLLKPNGSIYIHLDWRVCHHVKVLADEIFGEDNFLNEIVWRRSFAHGDAKQGAQHFGRCTDSILFYVKGSSATWNPQYTEYSEEAISRDYKYKEEETGRVYRLAPVDGPGGPSKGNPFYEFLGVKGYWRFKKERMQKLYEEGRIVRSSTGKSLSQKMYLDEAKGRPVDNLWLDVSRVSPTSSERIGYPTQKPVALLKRIIETSSNPGDIVLDCFCGSGTTAAVAEECGRRWIACDLSRFAIHTTRKRLLGVKNVKPFVLQNLGKYERQAWQTAEFGEEAGVRIQSYISFILQLYSAQPLNGHIWLHGVKGKRFVHVGSVDSPISPLDVGQIVAEFKRSIGSGKEAPKTNGIDILGWDFAFELNELAKQQAAQANVDLRFLRIPREVLDRKAVEQGDIHFFELAALDIGVKSLGKKVTVTINDFIIPVDDVPAEVQKEIKHWSQWIDYWAIDWDNKNDTFHNEWQEYRTREKPNLETKITKTYDVSGTYRIVVKVVDILGNDTTKLLKVELK